jgi:hypothetical protein
LKQEEVDGSAWKDGKIMFFLRGNSYIRYDMARDRADDGYPRPVDDKTWPGLARHRDDLAGMLNRGNGKAYLFLLSGGYLRYDIGADRLDSGYPKPMRRQFD